MSLPISVKLLKPLETSSSIGMFVRDTAGCLIARLGLARSREEAKEITFAETTESAIFYFSAPALAKGSAKIISKALKLNKDEFSKPLNELENLKSITSDNLKNIKLGKFAQIASTFSIILPFVFGIAPVRNLLTLADSGKNKFTNLIWLDKQTKSKNKNNENKNEALIKAKKLTKKLITAGGICLGLTGAVLGVSKNDKIYQKIEPSLTKFIKSLEFTKTGDLQTAHYAALIYPVSILGYFISCRDKYEVFENARRFSVTVPLLFLGEKIFQNPIYKFFDKKFKTNVMDSKGKIKSYDDILKLSKETQKQMLKSKNYSYGITFLINTIAIAGAVALLNRIQTKKMYNKENNLNNKNNIQTLKTLSLKDYQISTNLNKKQVS